MSDDLKRAKEKVDEYSNTRDETTSSPRKQDEAPQRSMEPRDLDQWASLADHRVEEAMRAGAFKNLPGHGKPIVQHDDPHEPSELRMANKLLKNNDLTPGWISDRSQLLQRIERLRQDLASSAANARRAMQMAQDESRQEEVRQRWVECTTVWEQEIDDLNRKILTVNLQLPTIRLELFALRLDEELAKVGMTTIGERHEGQGEDDG